MRNNRYYIYCCNYNAQPVYTHNRYEIVTVGTNRINYTRYYYIFIMNP